MREGSDAPEDGEGTEEGDLEEFRKQVAEKGVEGVDEETLEEWREGLADKDEAEDAKKSEGGEEAAEKGEPSEAAEPEKDAEADGALAEGAGPAKEEAKPDEEPEKTEANEGELGEGSEGKDQHAGQERSDTVTRAEQTEAKTGDEGEGPVRDETVQADVKDPPVEAKPPEREPVEKPAGPESEARADQENNGKPSGPDEERTSQAEPEKASELGRDEKPIQIEGYTRNDNQLLATENASRGRDTEGQAETPGLQRLQSEDAHLRVDGPRILEAVDYGNGANVGTPMGDSGVAKAAPNVRATEGSAGSSEGMPHHLQAEAARIESSRERQNSTSDSAVARYQNDAVRVRNPTASPETIPGLSSFYPSQGHVTVEVGRYNRNDNQIVLTKPDNAGEGRDRPEADDVVRSAARYMRSTALLVPEDKIPSHTENDVIAVTVTRGREAWKEYILYCKHKPGADKAYLDLRQLDAELHEGFKIRKVEVHSVEAFARVYNSKKSDGLGNTELVKRDDGLAMRTEGREIPLTSIVLRSQEGRAVLDARLGNSQVKIVNGVGDSEIRLRDHSKVTGIKTASEGIVLSYQRTNHDHYPHRRIIAEGAPEGPHFFKHEGPLLVGRINVESRSYGRDSIEFKVRASDAAYEHIFDSLAESGNSDAFKKLKGDVAEEVVRRLGPDLDMRIVADHPFNDNPLKVASERPGPDLLVSFANSEELAYVEIKWWAYKAGAAKEAELQVLEDLRTHPTWEGKSVGGAYTAILDWSSENEWFIIKLERVGRQQPNLYLK